MNIFKSRSKTLNLNFAGYLLIFIGIIFLSLFFIWPTVKVLRAKFWIKTSCNITKIEIKEIRNYATRGSRYLVEIKYQYQFGGNNHFGDRYSFHDRLYSSYDKATKFAQNYSVGVDFYCFVNSKYPDESVLYTGFSFNYILAFFSPFLFILIGVFWIRCR